jgi:allantoinase
MAPMTRTYPAANTGAGVWALVSRRVAVGPVLSEAAIVISGETIVDVVDPAGVPVGCPVEDVGDRVVLPGLVDTHVHINEPGRTDWEGFDTATRAAAAGGVTTLVDMPLNSSPVTATAQALAQKLEAARGKLWVDCGFYAGVIPGHGAQVAALVAGGVLGFKAFLCHSGIDEFPNAGESDLREVMPALAAAGVPLLVHAELPSSPVAATPATPDESRSYARHLASRPPAWEREAIRLMIDLCREHRCCVHIVHLASADALPMIARAREEGLPLTVETCPHYLTFAAEEISDGDPRFKCAPPIRQRDHRERLWEGLRAGLIDTIGSDHSPAPPALKHLASGDVFRAWGGIASLQIALPAVWTEARRRNIEITALARWMASRPAEILGLKRKGAISSGRDADLVVFDPDSCFVVDGADLFHRHKATPYEGRTLVGRVETTYLRGRAVYRYPSDFAGPRRGQPLFSDGAGTA